MLGGSTGGGATDTGGKPTILYVLAYPRSGTTVLGNLLGELKGYFHAGEVTYLWAPDLVAPRRRCGCGNALDECPVWHSIFATAFPEAYLPRVAPVPVNGSPRRGPPDTSLMTISHAFVPSVADSMARARSTLNGWKSFGRRALRSSAARERARYRSCMGTLYQSMASATGATVIVDSSKLLQDAVLVAGIPGIDARVLHVVRDGRGVALSRVRRISPLRPNGTRRIPTPRLALESFRWTIANAAMEVRTKRLACPTLILRYEALVADPEASLRRIADFVGQPAPDLSFLQETDGGWEATIGTNHTSGGNRNRWTKGTITLAEDVGWTAELGRFDQWCASIASWGGRARYGYIGR